MNNHWMDTTFDVQDLDALFYIFTFQSAYRCFPPAEAVVQATGSSVTVESLIACGYLRKQGTRLVPVKTRIWRTLRRQSRTRRPRCP